MKDFTFEHIEAMLAILYDGPFVLQSSRGKGENLLYVRYKCGSGIEVVITCGKDTKTLVFTEI